MATEKCDPKVELGRDNEVSEVSEVRVDSIVGLMTQEPLVQIAIDDVKVQLSPAEARVVALNLLECAQSAICDLFVVEFAMKRIATDMNGAAHLLKEFRDWRASREL